jgi:hypothetical protein
MPLLASPDPAAVSAVEYSRSSRARSVQPKHTFSSDHTVTMRVMGVAPVSDADLDADLDVDPDVAGAHDSHTVPAPELCWFSSTIAHRADGPTDQYLLRVLPSGDVVLSPVDVTYKVKKQLPRDTAATLLDHDAVEAIRAQKLTAGRILAAAKQKQAAAAAAAATVDELLDSSLDDLEDSAARAEFDKGEEANELFDHEQYVSDDDIDVFEGGRDLAAESAAADAVEQNTKRRRAEAEKRVARRSTNNPAPESDDEPTSAADATADYWASVEAELEGGAAALPEQVIDAKRKRSAREKLRAELHQNALLASALDTNPLGLLDRLSAPRAGEKRAEPGSLEAITLAAAGAVDAPRGPRTGLSTARLRDDMEESVAAMFRARSFIPQAEVQQELVRLQKAHCGSRDGQLSTAELTNHFSTALRKHAALHKPSGQWRKL